MKYYFGTTGKPENDKYIIPELKEMYDNDPSVKRIADMAIKLEGVPRNTSTHAAGVLISPEPVSNFVPLARNGDDIVTQYDMIELEHLGLLKMDFLGLITLTDIKKACDYVYEDHGIKIDFYAMDYDDPKVFELISSGKTDAVFQLESAGMKRFMKDLKPTCMDDVIAGISLYRPGPMDFIPKFVKNKQDPEHIEYEDPCLESILDVTYGCIVYQEQVMKIFQVMAGYSLGQADNIRRIMGKKQVDKIDKERVKFVNGWEDPEGKKSIPGAIKLGHKKEVAEELFDEMKESIGSSLNAIAFTNRLKNHPVCLTTKGDVSLEMEKALNAMPNGENIKANTTLEINKDHPIAKKLEKLYEDKNEEELARYSKILYAQARLTEGLSVENPTEISNLICQELAK